VRVLPAEGNCIVTTIRKDRAAKGYHAEPCQQCKTGLGHGQVKLFDSRCEGCHEKKAKGLRTGNEPPPQRRIGEKWVDYAKLARQKAARAKAMAALPDARNVRQ
jgi:hypothetical protein